MRRVIIESPYAASASDVGSAMREHDLGVDDARRLVIARNERYARAAMRHCIKRGESPFASHLLYTQYGVLDDDDPEERAIGMAAGFAWREVADATVVYTDLGISPGMEAGIKNARHNFMQVEMRKLDGWEG